MLFDNPTTITDALKNQTLKTVLALSPDIGTEEINKFLSPAIRQRVMYSARTPYAGYLSEIGALIQNIVQPDANQTPGSSISFAEARGRMKQALRGLDYTPSADDAGTIKDLSSDIRINTIINTQIDLSRGYGSWRESQDSTVLDLYPADELFRAFSRKSQRDWQTRWNDARSSLSSTTATLAETSGGPFVALKNDPIWTAISSFGLPYPPFDYGSGMSIRNVDQLRARDLGVYEMGNPPTPVLDPMNKPVSISLQDTTPALATALQEVFGNNAIQTQDRLHIMPEPVQTLKELIFRADKKQNATGSFSFVNDAIRSSADALGLKIPEGATFQIDSSHIRHIQDRHPEMDLLALPDLVASQGTFRKPTESDLHEIKPNSWMFETGKEIIGLLWGNKEKRLLVNSMYKK